MQVEQHEPHGHEQRQGAARLEGHREEGQEGGAHGLPGAGQHVRRDTRKISLRRSLDHSVDHSVNHSVDHFSHSLRHPLIPF